MTPMRALQFQRSTQRPGTGKAPPKCRSRLSPQNHSTVVTHPAKLRALLVVGGTGGTS